MATAAARPGCCSSLSRMQIVVQCECTFHSRYCALQGNDLRNKFYERERTFSFRSVCPCVYDPDAARIGLICPHIEPLARKTISFKHEVLFLRIGPIV